MDICTERGVTCEPIVAHQINNNNIRGLTSQNHDMIMRDAVVEGSENFDHLMFFNVHLNLSTRASDIFASIENAAAAAGIRSRDLRVSSRAP